MRIRHLVVAAVVAVFVVAPASAASAVALDEPQSITFSQQTASVTVGDPLTATLELGDWWDDACIGTLVTGQTCVSPKTLHVTLDGKEVVSHREIDAQSLTISIFDPTSTLHVGTHTLQAACDLPFSCKTSTPLTITATAAPLSVDGRIETDEAHPTGAIVTALLTGDVIDQYLGCDCSLDPAGRWDITVLDAKGATVTDRSLPVARGEQKDVSFYWNDVPRDGQFTAHFRFTTSGPHADDLAVTADSISYDSPAAGAPQDDATPDPSVQTVTAATERPSTLPAWAMVSAGVLALAVLIAIAVLVIRLARGPVLVVRRSALDHGDLAVAQDEVRGP